MRFKIITILTLMLLPMIAQAQRQQYQQVNDIPYIASSDAYAQERCKLDVYYPVDQKDAPVVVWFHGGGNGHRGQADGDQDHEDTDYQPLQIAEDAGSDIRGNVFYQSQYPRGCTSWYF